MTLNQKIADIYASSNAEAWSVVAPKMVTKKRFNTDKRRCLAWLNNDKNVCVLFEGTNSKINSVVLAYSFPDVAGPTILVFFHYHSERLTKPIIHNWIKALTSRYLNVNRILIQVSDQQVELKKTLKSMGAAIDSYEQIGPTKIPDFQTNASFSVRIVEPEFDFRPLLKIGRLAHESDSSSRVFGHITQLKNQTIKLLEACRKKQSLVVAFHKERPIGFLAIGVHDEMGTIYDIAVDPKYQGQGAAKILYKKGLEYFRENSCHYYKGATSTERVLGLSHLLQRTLNCTNYLLTLDDYDG